MNLCPACGHEKHVGRDRCDVPMCGSPSLEGGSPIIPCPCNDSKARKADSGKAGGFALLPWSVIRGLAAVYDYGRKKYAPNSWQSVPPDEHGRSAEERYEDAMFRHWEAYKRGEDLDPESGLPHLYHFLWGAVAKCWFDDQRTGWRP